MWNRKGFNSDIADFKTAAGVEQVPVNFRFEVGRAVRALEGGFLLGIPFSFERPNRAVLCATIAENGDVKFIGEAKNTGDVVGVFVGDEDGGKIFRRLADGGEAFADLQRGEAGVHEDAGFGGLDVGAVARRAAAENGEGDSHAEKLKRKADGGKRKALLTWRKLTWRQDGLASGEDILKISECKLLFI